jgi:regulatory subunit for Cdc7p protein kinase
MTSLSQSRRPLTSRTLPNSPSKSRVVSGSKRPRSPEHGEPHVQPILKRVCLAPTTVARDLQREKKAEREQREAEFRQKYTRAFPMWKFYFDTEKPLSVSQSSLRTRVVQLKAVSQRTIVQLLECPDAYVYCRKLWTFSTNL